MMRIISPRGKLVRVGDVVLCCEISFHFNGEDKRLLEEYRGIDGKPTALRIRYKGSRVNAFGEPFYGLLVGNLKPEQVKEIQKSLLKDGYFDFSELDYQEACLDNAPVFDNGETKPYVVEYGLPNTNCFEFSRTPNFTNLSMSAPAISPELIGEPKADEPDSDDLCDMDACGEEESYEQE